MFSRLALMALVAGAPLLLSSCSLLTSPISMLSRLFSAAGRGIGIGADNNADKPFRFDPGEIERVRAGENPLPQVEKPEGSERVASR